MSIEGRYIGSKNSLLGMHGTVNFESMIAALLYASREEVVEIERINKAADEGVIYLDKVGMPIMSNSKIEIAKAEYKLLYTGYNTAKYNTPICVALKRDGLGWHGSFVQTANKCIRNILEVKSDVLNRLPEDLANILDMLEQDYEFKGNGLLEILEHNKSIGKEFRTLDKRVIVRNSYRDTTDSAINIESTFYDELYDLLLIKENWKVSSKNRLKKHIESILIKIRYEQSINGEKTKGNGYVLNKNGSKCLINTGLLDKFNNDIYIVDLNNKLKDIDSRKLELFRSKTTLITLGFERESIVDLPKPIIFYNDIRELIFKASIEDFDLNDTRMLNHVLSERIHRFPKQYRDTPVNILAERVLSSLRTALKIAEKDFKYIAPMYNLTHNKIQYLVPIHLNSSIEEGPEIALVVGEDCGFYHAYTVLELDVAYDNARLICRPDSNWLKLNGR